MAIEFHCDHCGRMVKTSNEHAGKRGKCPHCHQAVYIPTPSDDIEPLELAPMDESEQRERERMQKETLDVTRAIRSDKTELPPETAAKAPTPEPLGDVRMTSVMETMVTDYVVFMFEGKLAEAEELAREIRGNMALAEEVIQRLAMDELPPTRLASIPRPVINGFIKQLREPE